MQAQTISPNLPETHRQRHEHGVLGDVGALVVAQLVGAPEAVLLLRAVILDAQLGAVGRAPQHQEPAVAHVRAAQLPLPEYRPDEVTGMGETVQPLSMQACPWRSTWIGWLGDHLLGVDDDQAGGAAALQVCALVAVLCVPQHCTTAHHTDFWMAHTMLHAGIRTCLKKPSEQPVAAPATGSVGFVYQ